MTLSQETRLRCKDLILAMVAGVLLDVCLVSAVHLIDCSGFGPLRRFQGPWGLAWLGPCAERTTSSSFVETGSCIEPGSSRP